MTLRSLGLVLAAAIVLIGLTQPAAARERTYYIAAEEITWNYAPSGKNLITGKALPHLLPAQLGWAYRKLVYRGYTDATFARHAARATRDNYLGILGPVLRAEVGDTIAVKFKNNTDVPLDFQPSGGLVGSPFAVRPGAEHTYRFRVPTSAGPTAGDGSSILWTYDAGFTHANATENAGLMGVIVVTRRGASRPDGSPADVDREIFAGFKESRETSSIVYHENLADPRLNPRKILGSARAVDGANTFVSINGYSYGNAPMIVLRRGERVRWYTFASNETFDFHMPTWNGQTVLIGGHRADTLGLSPSSTVVADMVPDNPGVWLFYCTLNVHFDSGMVARFEVTK